MTGSASRIRRWCRRSSRGETPERVGCFTTPPRRDRLLRSARERRHRRDRPRDPHRARLDGRDGRPGRRAVRRLDPAGGAQLPDLRRAVPAAVHPGAGAGQARRRRDERGARPARRRRRRRDRRGGTRRRRRRVRRPVPDRHLPDRLGHLDQHEHERGRRPPGGRAARWRTQGPPQRRRQPLPELERHDPDRAPAVGRDRDRGGPAARPRAPPHGAGRQGAGALAGGQDRADPPPGRDADPPRPGVPGLCRPGRGVAAAGQGRAGGAAVGAARRDRGRDRHQRPSRVRPSRLRASVRADRARRPRDHEPLPRPGHAGRGHRGPRRDPDDRAEPVEDRQRRPPDGDGAARRASPRWRSPRPSRARRSCRAR